MNAKITQIHIRIIAYIVILSAIIIGQDSIFLTFHKVFASVDFSSTPIKLLFLGFFAALGSYISLRIKIHNNKLIADCCFIVAMYILFRYNIIEHKQWEYVELCKHFAYADVIFLCIPIALAPKMYKAYCLFRKKRRNESSIIIADKSIRDKEDDLFGYYPDAELLASKILKYKQNTQEGAFVIGLRGEWGEGKTSYLNLLRDVFVKNYENEVIVLNFNTWLNHTYEQQSSCMLKIIADGVGDLTLSNIIADYSKVLSGAKLGVFSDVINTLSLRKTKHSDELFEEVSSRISQLNKLLVIHIDDIDRLTGSEALNTIKLIRNAANFKNTVFIVAYDETNICKALNSINIPDNYLEKVFNIVYTLPIVSQTDLMKVVKDIFKDALKECESNCDEHIDNFIDVIKGEITLRNTKRLASTITLSCSKLLDGDEKFMLDLTDYMLINYLGIVNYGVYHELALLKTDINGYLTDEQLKQNLLHFESNTISLEFRTKFFGDAMKRMAKKQGEQGDDYILTPDMYKQIKLEKRCKYKNAVELTYNIMSALFENDKVCGISQKNTYDMYFSRKLSKGLITKQEFMSSYILGSDSFKEKLKDWFENKDMHNLDRLISTMELESEDDWFRYLSDILSISSMNSTYRLMGRLYIPTPGNDLLNNREGNQTGRMNLSKALRHFLFDIEILKDTSFEDLNKKLIFYQYNKSMINTASILLSNDEQIKVPSEKDIFIIYWNEYTSRLQEYGDYHDGLLETLRDVHFQDKIDVREKIKTHIEENILSFIRYYTTDKLIDCNLIYVFSGYKTQEMTATDDGNWLPNFIEFLQGINAKNPIDELSNYIEECLLLR